MSESCLKDSPQAIYDSASPFLNLEHDQVNSRLSLKEQPIRGNAHTHRIGIRLFFVLLGVLSGCTFGWQNEVASWLIIVAWGLTGGLLVIGVLGIERIMQWYPASHILRAAQSIAIGIMMAALFALLLTIIFPSAPFLVSVLSLASLLTIPFLTLVIRNRAYLPSEQEDVAPWLFDRAPIRTASPKIFDTSTIIDGRILDLYETGFLEGPIRIPRFVLRELHHIADSSQAWKRARGKRGLEILNRLQEIPEIDVEITEQDFPQIDEVDHKLIKLAQQEQGKIVTNDWNLAKLASVEKIQTLNVNQLFHQLKPPVLPGEVIRVLVNKEGDLPGQGVAHLDDGTMIVVDQARDYVQKTVDVIITKFMQTQSGRILFASRL